MSILDKIEKLKSEISSTVASTQEELEAFRLKFISRKGILTELFEDFKQVANEEKRQVGQSLNELKNLSQGRPKSSNTDHSDHSSWIQVPQFSAAFTPEDERELRRVAEWLGRLF